MIDWNSLVSYHRGSSPQTFWVLFFRNSVVLRYILFPFLGYITFIIRLCTAPPFAQPCILVPVVDAEKPKQGPSSSVTKQDSFDFNKESANKGIVLSNGSGHHQIAAQTFTFRDLAAATSNFRADCLLGEGGFGRVYRGYLDSVSQVFLLSCLFYISLVQLVTDDTKLALTLYHSLIR